MVKFILPVLLFLGFFAFSNMMNTKHTQAMENIDSPVVLELFTSQSCSSCPPADRLLGKIQAENDNIIALSCHVTYWNHLHWEDTLSREFCSTRQRDYVRSLRSRGPYTPQIVINGADTMVGNQENSVRSGIVKAQEIKPITLTHTDDNLEIKLPETAGNDSYALHLVLHGDTHEQSIPSGENRGRTVSYTNPVQKIISLGTWDGTGKTMDHDLSDYSGYKGLVVLAQKNSPTGAIIAAGKVEK